MTRAPWMSSCMTLLSPSIFCCTSKKSGLLRQTTTATSMRMTGTASAAIMLKWMSSVKSAAVPAIRKVRLRTTPRSAALTIVCTCVVSLVIRVIKEPVRNASICSIDRCIMRWKQSLRMSLPKFCAQKLTQMAPMTPQKPPSRTIRTIERPVCATSGRSGTPP